MTAQTTEIPAARAPKPEPATRTGKLGAAVRRMPIARQVIPMEAMLGWPIPIGRNGRQYVKFPFVGMRPVRQPGVTALLFPPVATITVDWVTGRPVEYADLTYQRPNPELDWTAQAGTFPHPGVQGKVGDYLAAKDRLFELTDTVLDAGARGQGVPGAVASEYVALLAKLVEPDLVPFYRAIAPRFTERFATAPGA